MTIREAIHLAGQNFQARNNAEGESLYQQLLTHTLDGPTFLALAIVMRDCQQWEKALFCCQRGLALQPEDPQGHNVLGYVLYGQGHYAQAQQAFSRMLELSPRSAAAWNNLGQALYAQRQYEPCIAAFMQALTLHPNYSEAENNLGNTYAAMGEVDRAIPLFEKALAQSPQYAAAHWNLGLALLVKGDLARGWPEVEWRWKVADFYLRRNLAQPVWDGTELNGRRILLYAEQGFGDSIQFIRYAPLVAARGGKVAVICQAEVLALFAQIGGVDYWSTVDKPLPAHDVHCSLLSLPMAMGTTLANIPAAIPYLSADAALSSQWQRRVPSDGRLKIGIAWAGRALHAKDPDRSFLLSELSPLAHLRGLWLCSLQTGDAAAQINTAGLDLSDWTQELGNFADTAALVDNLDLVITADTAVAHLAGAMGKPAWVMLPYVPDWRWLLDRQDSPWYPTLRLFRQQQAGKWNSVVDRIVREISLAI